MPDVVTTLNLTQIIPSSKQENRDIDNRINSVVATFGSLVKYTCTFTRDADKQIVNTTFVVGAP